MSDNKLLRYSNRIFATGFFSGYLPAAPGTWGSFLGLILLWIFPVLTNIYVLIGGSLLGILICSLEENFTGIKDESEIVIDEIIGIFITFAGDTLTPFLLISGFIMFRVFDIFKPWVIDRSQKLPGGLGVMADDILAGILTNIFLKVVIYLI